MRNWRTPAVMTIALGILLAAASSAGVSRADASEVLVNIPSGSSGKTTNAYLPDLLYVSVGDTVTWKNNDSVPHTVTSGSNAQPDGKFDSSPDFNPLMLPKQTFSRTFEQAGEYPYYCGLHPNMEGTVIAQDGNNKTTVSVAAEKSSYGPGDDIKIAGKVTATNETTSQHILLRVIDPEGYTDWIDHVAAAEDGSFSYSFKTSALMTTEGTYTAVALYKSVAGKATFHFGPPDPSDEEEPEGIFTVKANDQFYHIRYWITGGRVIDMSPSEETASFTVEISAISNGRLTIELPREVIDSRAGADARSGDDEEFVAFADEVPADVVENEAASTASTRQISIDFVEGTGSLEIVGTWDMSPPPLNEWETAYAVGKFLNSEPLKPDQIFNIQYKVTGGTIERLSARHGFAAEVNSTGDSGTLEVKFPRNYPYTNDPSNTGGEAVLFINGQEVVPEYTITDCFFVFSVPFSGSSEIELAWSYAPNDDPYHGDNIPESCISETTVKNVPAKKDGTIAPLWQFRAGVAAEDAICPATKQREELMLLVSPDGRPFCVKLSDEGFMKKRGWTEPHQ